MRGICVWKFYCKRCDSENEFLLFRVQIVRSYAFVNIVFGGLVQTALLLLSLDFSAKLKLSHSIFQIVAAAASALLLSTASAVSKTILGSKT